MSPEKQWLEDVFSYWNNPVLGDMLVFRGVYLPKFEPVFIFFIDFRTTKFKKSCQKLKVRLAKISGWVPTKTSTKILKLLGR